MALSFNGYEERVPFAARGRYLPTLVLFSALVLTAWSQSTTSIPSRLKFEITRPEARNALLERGGRRLADYGSYELWDLPADQRGVVAEQEGVKLREDDSVIELHSGAIRTSTRTAPTNEAAPAAFKGRQLYLVQFVGPIQPQWYKDLEGSGARIVSHVPRNAYLVYCDTQALTKLRTAARRSSHIQWESDYRPEHKIHPGAQKAVEARQRGMMADDLFAVQLVEDSTANAETLRLLDQIQRAWVRQTRKLGYVNCVLRLPHDRLAEVAALPDVVSIQPYAQPQKRDERQDQILAGNLTGDQPSGPGYLSWVASKGFTAAQFAASGFVVDVTDSGIDNGTSSPGHFGLYTMGDRNLPSRVVYNRLVGNANFGSTIQACDGHGNINAHIIAGYNNFNGFPHTDSAGYHYGLGVCPFVRVGSSVIFDPDIFTYPDYSELQSRAYQDGARISCNSWGASIGGAYNIDCQMYDALVRDAQPDGSPFPTPGNQEMVIIFSAGNSGPGANTIGAPGSAKNIITVGAAENVHSHSTTNGGNNTAGNDGCNISDSGADSANDIISFSSRGPCDDLRIKPDIMGPGTHITGGVAQENSPGVNGTALACFQATGVCALPGSGIVGDAGNFFPLGQQFFTTSSGTSHSCPAVGGGAALLRQYFINHNWSVPSAAMTKAWLMNSARYMVGSYANDTLPSNNQGMGSMNLGTAFDGVARTLRDQKEEDRFTATGQTRVFDGFIRDPTKPFRVTLAWTDAPGSTVGNAYNNDLDLMVVAGEQTYRGNVFNGAGSVPGGSADPRNNVESIFLPAGLAGPFTITVMAANINSDSVPGNADPLDQDFALVVYNSDESEVRLVPSGTTLLAENCGSGQGAIDPGETVTVALALQNIGPSNTTDLVVTLLPVNGVVPLSGPQNYGVVMGDRGPVVSRSFTFTAGGQCGCEFNAVLQLQDGTNDHGTVQFPFLLGALTTNQLSFTNHTLITIGATNGVVTPYPSLIWIGNASGKISRAIVTLNGINHSWPDDLDVVLVGAQRAVMLLSDAGDGYNLTNTTLVFDSAAIDTLPDEALLTSGTWQPTDYETDTPLPSPAPSGPYTTSLSVLAGRNPNGLWRLYVADDYSSDDGGEIHDGWSLTLVLTNHICCIDPVAADLAIGVSDAPDPVSISNIVTYTINVTNNGPAAASNVTLVSVLSPNAAFLDATPSQGSYTQDDNTVTCDLGSLSPGGRSTVFISALAVSGLELVNTVDFTAAQPDPNPLNNHAVAATTVVVPSVGFQNITVPEGNSGTQAAVFLLVLSQPAAQTAHVNYFTTNGTATAGTDYVAVSNQVTFLPGETVQTIQVPIIGDLLDEDDEIFTVLLANPVNATLNNSNAMATILDDDPVPVISISDSVVMEGNTGTTNAVFSINLSALSGRFIQASCSTSSGTAQAGQDFQGVLNRPVAFAPGQTATNFVVTVNGDTDIEPDETFYVSLNNPTNAVLGRRLGVGSIISDDLLPLIETAGYRIVTENGTNNGVMEPGETITISLALVNRGSANTTNLVAMLQPAGGVVSPSGPQSYGVLLPGGQQVSRSFTFTVGVFNCGALTLTFDIQDGGVLIGSISFDVVVGNCFFDDFEPDIDLAQWSSFGGNAGSTVLATNYGGSVSPVNSLWFGDDGSRFATTRPINTADGGTISFYLRLADGTLNGQWEVVDLPGKGVVLEYSTNNGDTWVQMGAYDTTAYYEWTGVSLGIPEAAQTTATMFRWRQLQHSGSCCDHWAIDDVLVLSGPRPPVITTHPSSRTVIAGSAVALTVTAEGSSPLSYQWRFYNTNIFAATNATLTLVNVTSNQAGFYSVAVANAYGSAVSSNAILTVIPGISLGEAVDMPGVVWATSGNQDWTSQTGVTHDGVDAAQSGGITNGQSSWMEMTVTGPGILSFWWKISSEINFDQLRFESNGVMHTLISGEVNWTERIYSLAPGSHTLRWTYAKDGDTSLGLDKAWLDQVTFTPGSGGLHHFVWYIIGATQTVNVPFSTTITALDAFNDLATNFSGKANLSAFVGGQTVGTILDNPIHNSANNGSWTLGYAFTPTNDLLVTHVRHYFGTKVSIWTDDGTLLAVRNVVSTPGTWTETPLTTPVLLAAGTPYRVAAYTAGNNFYWRTNLPSTFVAGTIDQGYDISGDGFPDDPDPARWWFVDLRYVAGSSVPLVTTPALAGPFVNGVWMGPVTVLQTGTNVSLVASDLSSHNGASSTFVVKSPPTISSSIRFQSPTVLSDGSFVLWLEHSDETPISGAEAANISFYWTTNLALPFTSWQPVPNSVTLTNGMLRLDGLNISNAASQFFRAQQSP